MKANLDNTAAGHGGRRPLIAVGLLALVSAAAYAVIARLSWRFTPDQECARRPILVVLGLLGIALVAYLAALAMALRTRDDRRLLGLILAGSVIFRLTLLFSWPIQEVDIYRYLWDGAAVTVGVSPYRYSPQQVLAASAEQPLPEDLGRLVALRDKSPSLATILSRVHYSELPTIYPPVSQAVFALATCLTPRTATVLERIVIMKAVFVLFDLATLGLVIGLVWLARLHVGWSLAYGWCPLVIKEISNTGHLDALAVLLTTLAVLVTVWATWDGKAATGLPRRLLWSLLGAALLALGVGAKLYPLVLAPWFVAAWVRRLGWRWAVFPIATAATMGTGVLWAMMPSESVQPSPAATTGDAGDESLPPPPAETADTAPRDPTGGLKAFLRRWEMNDFLFMLVVENLKPVSGSPALRPWFGIIPDGWRTYVVGVPARWLHLDPPSAAFLLTRGITGAVFLALALGLAWGTRRSDDPSAWLRAAFLTLAWFWLLSPTQNPWYWTWALPLVMFAESRAWLAVSGLALTYYLRFWLDCHWPTGSVLAAGYAGAAFFDFVVTWVEFGPLLVYWSLVGGRSRWRRGWQFLTRKPTMPVAS